MREFETIFIEESEEENYVAVNASMFNKDGHEEVMTLFDSKDPLRSLEEVVKLIGAYVDEVPGDSVIEAYNEVIERIEMTPHLCMTWSGS